jgi:hypothetical protein
MKLRKINSSSLAATGYDPEAATLTLKFQSGETYDYFQVKSRVYRGLLRAASAGAYFQKRIRGKYPYHRH